MRWAEFGCAPSTRSERVQSECRRAARQTLAPPARASEDVPTRPVRHWNHTQDSGLLSRSLFEGCLFACTCSVRGFFSWSTSRSSCWTSEARVEGSAWAALRTRAVSIDSRRSRRRVSGRSSVGGCRACRCGAAACRERRWCRRRCYVGLRAVLRRLSPRSLRTRRARGRAARPPWARPRRRCAARRPTPPRCRFPSPCPGSSLSSASTMPPSLLSIASLKISSGESS